MLLVQTQMLGRRACSQVFTDVQKRGPHTRPQVRIPQGPGASMCAGPLFAGTLGSSQSRDKDAG